MWVIEQNIWAYILELLVDKRCMESMCGQKLQNSCVENAKFIHIVDTLKSRLDKDDFESMVMLIRNLWVMRNSLIN
jgi:hypothetical protein